MKGTRFVSVFTRSNVYLLLFSALLAFLPVMSCTSSPEAVQKIVEPEPEAVVQKEPAESSGFKVSEDVYSKTFSDITLLIETLNTIIRSSNFDEWKKYLTKEYIDFYSNQDNLKIYNETPILKKHNIVLRSLKDYFNYVVGPSRSDVQLDDISFIDDNNIKAYMRIDGEPVVLYTLINIQGNWKIGL